MNWPRLAIALTLAAACSNKPETPADTGVADASDSGTPDSGAPDLAQRDTSPEPDSDQPDAGSCGYVPGAPEDIQPPSRIHTPRWAFQPWISKDISSAADTYAFVDGFISRDIPVGTVVLDSPWETNYNTFVPNPDRYPNFPTLVSDMRDRDVRVVLWTTQMVNQISFDLEMGGDTYDGPASNYAEAVACDFFVESGRLFTWWKGRGGAIDFTDPIARQWWHEQQATLLDQGVAGWKLDFGESYVRLDTVQTDAGEITRQQYSESYYKDFYDYGVQRRGDEEFLTMVRAYDKSYDFDGRFFARPEHAPVVWVGDNRRDWVGLADALDHTFRSAVAGYTVIGSDLGGYLNRDDEDLGVTVPFDRVNFLRWLAASAMSPFMQLHGRANLTPWTLPDDPDPDASVDHYRYWSHVHAELVPFWYSLAQESYAGNQDGIIRPLGVEASWAGDYRYMLGDAFLVAPILDGTGIRDVAVPPGTYYDWWDEQVVSGGATTSFDYAADLRRIPLLVKSGAVVPIASESAIAGLTQGGLGAADVVLAWPDIAPSTFVAHDPDGQTTTHATQDRGADVVFTASRAARPLVVRLRFDDAVAAVTVDGTQIAAVASEAELLAGPSYRVAAPYIWISSPIAAQSVEFVVRR